MIFAQQSAWVLISVGVIDMIVYSVAMAAPSHVVVVSHRGVVWRQRSRVTVRLMTSQPRTPRSFQTTQWVHDWISILNDKHLHLNVDHRVRVESRPTIVLQCFDAVRWVIWPVKIVSDMTYNVFGGTLNPTLLLVKSQTVSRIVTLSPPKKKCRDPVGP